MPICGSLSCLKFGMSERSSPNRSNIGGFLTRGGSLCMNRLVIGCVPAPGSCLPGPGYVGVGISNANRSVTGFTDCVPAPSGCLSSPRYVGVGISNANRSVTDGVPPSGSGLHDPGVCWIGNPNLARFSLAPLRGPSRRVCPGSLVSASAPTASGPVPVQTHEAGESSHIFKREKIRIVFDQYSLTS